MMRLWILILIIPTSISDQIIRDVVGIPLFPLSIKLKKNDQGHYGLHDKASGITYPLQWIDDSTAFYLYSGTGKADQSNILRLKKITQPKSSVSLVRDQNGILVKSGNEKIFYYQTATAMPPVDSPAVYQRSGFIHPLYSPAGKILTDDFPVTHAHQHAIFHAWTDTRFRGSHVDFWNQFKQEGTVRHKGVISTAEGPVFSELVTHQEYVSLKHGVVLLEKWTIRIYAIHGYNLFDLLLDQENITKDTLWLDKYIYGGMAFRGAAQWDSHNKKYFQNSWNVLTSEGLKDSLANHKPAKWVTVSGKIDGTNASVTVFDHPLNFRSPQKIRVHPYMPYWVFSPVVDASFIIPPGGKYRARYRYYVCDEIPDQDVLRRMYEEWSNL